MLKCGDVTMNAQPSTPSGTIYSASNSHAKEKSMYQEVMATLRYGKLGNGTHIPLSYALETDDGRSVIFQSGMDFAHLAYHLGADIDIDDTSRDGIVRAHTLAMEWLDERLGDRFDIAHSYAELLEDSE